MYRGTLWVEVKKYRLLNYKKKIGKISLGGSLGLVLAKVNVFLKLPHYDVLNEKRHLVGGGEKIQAVEL